MSEDPLKRTPMVELDRDNRVHSDLPFPPLIQSQRLDEWSCGHTASAMCAECWRILANKAHELAEENVRLKEQLEQEREISRRAAIKREVEYRNAKQDLQRAHAELDELRKALAHPTHAE